MGGVDKVYMFLAMYRTNMKIRKWYHRIAVHLRSHTYVIYKEMVGKGFLLQFLMDACRLLCGAMEHQQAATMHLFLGDDL